MKSINANIQLMQEKGEKMYWEKLQRMFFHILYLSHQRNTQMIAYLLWIQQEQ